jgi:hypothetical protein
MLTAAEAYGRSAWETVIAPAFDNQVSGVPRKPPVVIHASSDPADAVELDLLAAIWAPRRECGLDEWKSRS